MFGPAALASGCAIPCVDDGFLNMQHACGLSNDTTTASTTLETGGSTMASTTASTTTTAFTTTTADTTTTDTTTTDATTTDATTTDTTTTDTATTTGTTTIDTTTTASSSTGSSSTSGGPVCGDTLVDPGEECDDGQDGDPDDGCTDLCKLPACGDAFVQASLQEVCDDGNADEFDACNSKCKPTPTGIKVGAGKDTATEGGPGGSAFDDPCKGARALVGFKGDLDDNGRIGRIYGLCAPLLVTSDGVQFNVEAGPTTDLPIQGKFMQMGAWSALCPAGHVLLGFRGKRSMWIDQLVFRCAPLTIAAAMNGTYDLAIGPSVELLAVGTEVGGMNFGPVDCLAGQVGTGQIGSSGDVIDSLGLACSVVELVPP